MTQSPVIFKPVKQEKLYSQVYEQVIDLIERGEFAQGDRLPPERELAQKLNVSRATLREALTVMQMMGVVKTVSGQGTFIGKLPASNTISLPLPQLGESPFVILEARKAIEPAIARLAAEVSTDESHQKIEAILEWMEADHTTNQVVSDRFSEGDRQFHLEIAHSTENPVIITIQEMIYTYTGQALWLTLMRHSSFSTPNRWEKSLHEHRVIYEAIRDRNPDLASARVQAHLRRVERIMVQADLITEVPLNNGPDSQ
jgi:GntR family transcriptional repressor for pyruvate dehydrogenase complex